MYQCCQSTAVHNDYGNSDLLSRLTVGMRPICGFCLSKCKNYWLVRKTGTNSESPLADIPNPDIQNLCMDCKNHEVLSPDITAKYFEEVFVLDEFSAKKNKQEKTSSWSYEEKLRLMEAMEECQLDIAKVVLRFPGKTAHEIVKKFLLIPLSNFRGILKLTNQHFENIFKRDFSSKKLDLKNDILPYQVLLLDFLFKITV